MSSTFKVFDSDDFGCNHVISDMTQSHDCRDVLVELKALNPNFKATLFAIPGEMNPELSAWAQMNASWIELAVHGFFHQTNYECSELLYEDMAFFMDEFKDITKYFVKGFKAPGWQISDDVYRWLLDNGYWVADQSYNNDRRPIELPVYVNQNGEFGTMLLEENGVNYFHRVSGVHTHTWDCVGNGVYELRDQLKEEVKNTKNWKFISEVLNA